ncbi:carbon-nitrogen hydrolase family protein [Biomphalaria pfeifferi]|uniref:Carbon-nitrogen hydrolase family protein n=1 Tax=Biomphalaria pfeifferi TaxID=112525 RepID=A0AAD8AMQ2_BIOPF|nr:carbon-nitrogen hydrolase family protein [Biomphalaria pfeifferi]
MAPLDKKVAGVDGFICLVADRKAGKTTIRRYAYNKNKVSWRAISSEFAEPKSFEQRHRQIANQIVEAANKGARYVILPELAVIGSLTGNAQENVIERSETIPGPTTRFFAEYARKLNIFLAFTVLEKNDYGEGYYLTAVLLDEKGEIRVQRRKVAPRIGGGDGSGFVRGNPRTVLESYDNGSRRIGLLSGDDLQAGVPRLASRGASVIFVSANLSDKEVVNWDETCRKLASEHKVILVVANGNTEGKEIRGTYLADGSKVQSTKDESEIFSFSTAFLYRITLRLKHISVCRRFRCRLM